MKIKAIGHLVKTNPIQTQSNPIAERVKLMQSVYLQRIMKKNAAKGHKKTKPKQTQFPKSQKMNANAFLQKDYENETTFRLRKNKPNQTQSQKQKSEDRRQKTENRRQKTEDGYCWKIPPGATIFNPIKKLTTNRTGANLKGQRIIWRSGCFWTWGIGTYFLGDRRMESHTERKLNIKNQSAKIRNSTILIFGFLFLICQVGFAQEAVAGAGEPNEAGMPSFPYVAEITGDDLYVRSGPGTNYYHCGKLNKGDKVKVVDRQFSWSCIVPPAGSFSWISMQYVKIDPNNPAAGTVTGDSVRVYAGSDYVKPLYSTTLQGKLNRGEKVKLLGEQMDDYYKIAPPAFAYLWVSTDFTKPLKSVGEVPLVGPNGTLVVGPEMVSAEVRLKEYQALEKQIKAEQAKPMDQQNYTKIKRGLVTIADDKTAGKAARYAEFMIKQIDGFELALAVGKEVQLQNKQLQKIKEGIDKARVRRLAEVEDMGRFAAVGRLQTFMTYGPGHYRIVDESGKTACYALPANYVSTMNLGRLIDRKVGLVGTVEPHRQTAGALVRFVEIVEID